MNVLLKNQAFLQAALLNDPLQQLALVVTWLDPLWIGVQDSLELDPNEQEYQAGDDPIPQALLVCRECFPEVYVESIAALHRQCSRQELDNLLCDGFSAAGIPVDNLEWAWYGIPLPAYGSQLYEAEFYEQFPESIPILAGFGVETEVGDMPDEAYSLAVMIVERLRQEENELARKIAWTIAWLWSCTGNSCCDLDYESLMEFEPLRWEKESVAFAQELIQEAETILSDALEGLDYLHEHPEALAALSDAIAAARKLYFKVNPEGEKLDYEQPSQLAHKLHLDRALFAGGTL